jgi:hypothetical protein
LENAAALGSFEGLLVILVRLLHLLKQLFPPIPETPLPMVTLAKAVQLEKQ